jgi:hypothetical protein
LPHKTHTRTHSYSFICPSKDLAEAEKEKIEAIEAMRKKYNRNFDVFEEYAQQNFSPVKKKIRVTWSVYVCVCVCVCTQCVQSLYSLVCSL